jgi:hypothetical protein
MILTQPSLRKRIQYIIHRGFIEIRNLALTEWRQQVHDLADAMEILPRYFDECSEEDLAMVRFVLQDYRNKYPQSTYRYLEILEGNSEPPERY